MAVQRGPTWCLRVSAKSSIRRTRPSRPSKPPSFDGTVSWFTVYLFSGNRLGQESSAISNQEPPGDNPQCYQLCFVTGKYFNATIWRLFISIWNAVKAKMFLVLSAFIKEFKHSKFFIFDYIWVSYEGHIKCYLLKLFTMLFALIPRSLFKYLILCYICINIPCHYQSH